MSTLKDICNLLESIAPLSLQENYDNCGLLIGDKNKKIKSVLISLDVTEAVVDEAIKDGCDVIIAHHPLVFSGIKKINPDTEQGRCIIKAVKNDIAIYAGHTNFDNIENGVNAVIASKIGLLHTKILQPKKNTLKKMITFVPKSNADQLRNHLFDAGAGNVGNYSRCSFNSMGEGTFEAGLGATPFVGEVNKIHFEAETRIEVVFPSFLQQKIISALLKNHPYEEVAYDILSLDNANPAIGAGIIGMLAEETDALAFLTVLKATFGAKGMRYTALPDKKIKKIAVCGGSGSFLLGEAIRQGADLFISSDFKYHQFFEAEKLIVIADIGHYESEQYTKQLFYDLITKNFTTFAVRLTKINTNPINYL
jgi:dinuclear metal center YbgI/SA1388 family protein